MTTNTTKRASLTGKTRTIKQDIQLRDERGCFYTVRKGGRVKVALDQGDTLLVHDPRAFVFGWMPEAYTEVNRSAVYCR
jgi:hypothetical protein